VLNLVSDLLQAVVAPAVPQSMAHFSLVVVAVAVVLIIVVAAMRRDQSWVALELLVSPQPVFTCSELPSLMVPVVLV
jgi:hypothetical protein